MTAAAQRYQPAPLLQFIPALSPRLQAPYHLGKAAELFDRIDRGTPVQAFITAPPRHGKSELLKHAAVRLLLGNPRLRIGYASYAAKLASKKSREIRSLYKRAGGQLAADAFARDDWRTGVGDGGLWAGGVEGAWTGEGFDLLIVDDPIQDRAHAESAVEREALWDWFNDVAFTRLEPTGSVIVLHTRWHTNDLGGRLIAEGWENICLPALSPSGEPLWPQRFNAEHLAKIRKKLGEYGWASLYMGQPFKKGGRVFGDAHLFSQLPEGLAYVIGVDLAYSAKTHADWSVACVVGFDMLATVEDAPCHVAEVLRRQVEAPQFIAELEKLAAHYPGAPLVWYYAGPEKGLVDIMKSFGLGIDARPAIADKFQKAQPTAAAWNAGQILLPRNRGALDAKLSGELAEESVEWMNDFLTEVVAFTGVKDLHDDQTDALGNAYDAGRQPSWIRAMAQYGKRGTLFEQDKTPKEKKIMFCQSCKMNYLGPCPKHVARARE
jgi:phage terminase large subunit-like protein